MTYITKLLNYIIGSTAWRDWPGYPIKRLYVTRIYTGHERNALSLLGRHLASRAIKELKEQITTVVLNIDRRTTRNSTLT